MDGFQSLVIIGAARSGTNMLRDILTQIPELTTWPCDEINYLWRYQNSLVPTDELRPEHAQPKVVQYIRSQFQKLARRHNARWVVEKTCANSLRVSFVDRVLPDARYVFLVRDGHDVVASAMKRWTARLDWRYVARKARYVPLADLPYYASRYLLNRLYRLQSRERRLASWGPRFAGMPELLQTHTLAEVCAAQWARSVDSAARAFRSIDPDRVVTIRYEDFVQRPLEFLEAIVERFQIPVAGVSLETLVNDVKTGSVARWRHELDAPTVASIERMAGLTLNQWKYLSESAAIGPQPYAA